MTDLLMLAVDAHGGLARWNRFKTLNARISMEGLYGKPKAISPKMKDLRI
jgi:hypothetical protein